MGVEDLKKNYARVPKILTGSALASRSTQVHLQFSKIEKDNQISLKLEKCSSMKNDAHQFGNKFFLFRQLETNSSW